ncbi:MAG: hypothetical protein V3R25_09900 [Nitrosomonadaceae bacterium]
MFDVDPQIKEIEKGLSDGQKFYPATRTVCSEWPKMATRGNGKGKGKTSKACANQTEYDEYMKGAKVDAVESVEQKSEA